MDATAQDDRRPVWVWIICAFYFVTAALTLATFAVVFSGAGMTAEQEVYFRSMTVVERTFSTAVAAASLAGAVSLFLRRRITVILFASALALSVALTVFQLMRTNVADVRGVGFLGVLVAWSALLAVILYARALAAKGRLR